MRSDEWLQSDYSVPVTNNAQQAARIDTQANYPCDLDIRVRDDSRGAPPARNFYSHESAPLTMNSMAAMVEKIIMALSAPFELLPDTAIGHRGNTWPQVEQAPYIDVYTQKPLPEPRMGYRGIYPYDLHQRIPFPNPWE